MDERVINLIKAQNEEGLILLKQHYSGLMHYIVRNILESPEDVEECINDITVKIWRSIDSYSPKKSKFTTWLTVIARNTSLSHLKSKQKYSEKSEGLDENYIDPSTPEAHVLKRERTEELKKAIALLTHEEQHIFYRKYYYLQNTSQIAAELGRTERSIEGKLYRLRKKLQDNLGGDFR
ncbi:MAG TPA: sigma-70 family RNA polymerase sigma factor [Anaerovoracaceae bacterium]|nr:sigma-70 family RNA polymerase sigma factor [Anaerovoracaceae bacterium]